MKYTAIRCIFRQPFQQAHYLLWEPLAAKSTAAVAWLGPLQCLLSREQTSLLTKHCRSEPQISSNINQRPAGWALTNLILHESLWLAILLCGLQFVPKHSQSFTSLSYAFIHTKKQLLCNPRGTSFGLPPNLEQREISNCCMLSRVQALCEKGRKQASHQMPDGQPPLEECLWSLLPQHPKAQLLAGVDSTHLRVDPPGCKGDRLFQTLRVIQNIINPVLQAKSCLSSNKWCQLKFLGSLKTKPMSNSTNYPILLLFRL